MNILANTTASKTQMILIQSMMEYEEDNYLYF